jgi:hypothetical protein
VSAELPDYLVGQKGVNLVQSPLHTPESGLLVGENVEFIRDQGLGGIGSRRPIGVLNDTPFNGPILAMANVPLPSPFDATADAGLYVSTEASNVGWLRSVDGAVYTTIADTTLERAFRVFNNPSNGTHPQKIPRAAVAVNDIYFAGDTSFSAEAPTLRRWDGSADTLLETFSGVGQVTDIILGVDGLLRISVLITNASGAVYTFDVGTEVLTQVGATFSPIPPYCVCEYGGTLFAGTGMGGTPTDTPEILRFVSGSWMLDYLSANSGASFRYLAAFDLDLFAVENVVSATPGEREDIILRREAGVWSTSYTPAAADRTIHWPIEFSGDLYAFVVDVTNSNTEVVKWDGAAWTVDVVLDTIEAPTGGNEWYPLQPVLFEGALYVPCSDGRTAAGGSDRIFKRTSLGVWSSVASGRNFQNAGVAVLI